jgi:DNA-directed RNA polymerase specialized sigma24 family protein
MGRISNLERQPPPPDSTLGHPAGDELTADALEALLTFLGPDRWSAAREYEKLRCKLLRLFELRGAPCPEELADRTFDRAARCLIEGHVRTENRFAYLRGIAHHVFLETCREEQGSWNAGGRRLWPESSSSFDRERRLAALDRCLEQLGLKARGLLLDYHAAADDGRLRARIARRLGISTNALCIRAHRLRKNVEGCVRQRLGGGVA